MNGDTAGVGNTDEIPLDDIYEKGYWNDDLNRAFVELSVQYNGIYNLDIWN